MANKTDTVKNMNLWKVYFYFFKEKKISGLHALSNSFNGVKI